MKNAIRFIIREAQLTIKNGQKLLAKNTQKYPFYFLYLIKN